MRDLEKVLDVVERVPTPDLWNHVELRAAHLPPGGLDLPVVGTPIRQRVAAGIVAFAVFGAVVALAFGAELHRPQPGPGTGAHVDTVTITFSADRPTLIAVNGVPVEGEMRNGYIHDGTLGSHVEYQFFPDRMLAGSPGSHVAVKGATEAQLWITECCRYGADGPRRISELDLASAVLPEEPGSYFVELEVYVAGWGLDEGSLTFLFPVRVVPPDEEEA